MLAVHRAAAQGRPRTRRPFQEWVHIGRL